MNREQKTRAQFIRQIQRLAEMAKDAKRWKGFDDLHKAELDSLAAAATEAGLRALEPPNGSGKPEHLETLIDLIATALAIGQRVGFQDGATRGAFNARVAKEPRSRSLRQAVELAAEGCELADTIKFAESIRDGVRNALPEELRKKRDSYPSASTVRREIRLILAERTKG